MLEIEKVKKRREERAIKKAKHEEEMALLARERAKSEFQDWEKKEKEIRLREGRLKPIDILSKYLSATDDCGCKVDELDEPYMVFQGLAVKDMEELREDINMYLNLDRETPNHVVYWEALLVVCDWELAEARKMNALDRARVHGKEPPAEVLAEERGLHSSVEEDVANLLHGKTCSELEMLQIDIESQMRAGTAKVVEYWEVVLTRLHIFKAKACLKEVHSKLLLKDLQKPQAEDDIIAHDVEDVPPYSSKLKLKEEWVHEVEEEPGSFSPELLHDDENEEAIDPSEDKNELNRKRASRVMGDIMEGDAVFGCGAEVNLDSQVYWWHDKYRPRKPKYFNQKVEGSIGETCLIRFHAGPPYEDIGFKIVNKEWEYSHKKGFKCTFERGILHVYFNFSRYWYRK
ncbi:hypothetical protein MKW94_027476 [Papaver nudicaule]|uniref:Splicing factor Cactin n=1 Tax=Papaver nudicaule TaxID=74823 RepID=A0AA41RTF5_PAPNU|nr:hypothetical protein [Papaver nudicaule]